MRKYIKQNITNDGFYYTNILNQSAKRVCFLKEFLL